MKQPLPRAQLGLILILILGLVRAFAQGTAFTYQGRLAQNNVPATGSWDLQFTLHDAVAGGGQVGGTVTELAVPVDAGQFTVTLDFGAQFNGPGRWLELSAKPAGGPTYTTYSPRQPVTPTPYAIRAGTAGVADSANTAAAVSGPVPATQLTGTVPLGQLPATLVQDGQSGVTLSGTFSGNGAGLTGVPGTLNRVTLTGTSVSAAPNTAYYVTGSSAPDVSLPTSATLGDVVQLHGIGAGWEATLVPATPAGATWTPVAGVSSVTGVAIAANSPTWVAGGYGGLFTSTDAGVTWTARQDPAWWKVAVSADGQRMLASSDFLYTSTDGGVTWTPRESSRSWRAVAVSSDGLTMAAAAISGPLVVSTDGGATWTSRDTTRAWHAVAMSADGTKIVAGEWGGFLRVSDNQGVTWSATGEVRTWADVAMSADGQRIYAAPTGGSIYASTDGGETWTTRASSLNWNAVACSATGEVVVAGNNVGQLHVSTDFGVTWTARASSENWFDLASTSDGTGMMAGAVNTSLHQSWGTPAVTLAGAVGTDIEFRYQGNGNWKSSYLSQSHVIAAASAVSISAGGTLVPTTSTLRLSAATPVTLSTTTAIADGSAAGSLLLLEGTSDTATITVPNAANTQLGAARTLGSGDVLTLLWNGTDWVQVSFSNN